MILIDTHIWVWWVQALPRLTPTMLNALDNRVSDGIGVSAISCWEVAMLNAKKRIQLPHGIDEWIEIALDYPGVREIELSRDCLVHSCNLPGNPHQDPIDRMLIASARILEVPLVTADARILDYSHVNAIHPRSL